MRYQLTRDEVGQGLRLERELATAVDLARVAENNLRRYVAQLGAMYQAPEGYQIRDWMQGFEQAQETNNGDNDGQPTDGTDGG